MRIENFDGVAHAQVFHSHRLMDMVAHHSTAK